MNTPQDSNTTSPFARSRPPRPAARIDLYGAPHKAIRLLLANLLTAMGRASFADAADAGAIAAQTDHVIRLCDAHIAHEDAHVRPALVARASSAVLTLDEEHAEHAVHVEELRAIVAALRSAPDGDARTDLGRVLYLQFTVFVAETLVHMAYEERVVQPLLDRLFSPAEVGAIQEAIFAAIPPEEMFLWLGPILTASSREERAEVLSGVRAKAPPPAFAGLLVEARKLVSADDWSDLSRRLAL